VPDVRRTTVRAPGVELLIAAGADVNAAGDMGETPLHVALRQQDRQTVQAPLRAGARTDLRSEVGETAHELAARIGGDTAGWLEAD
jgi:ankyrin repeat protein